MREGTLNFINFTSSPPRGLAIDLEAADAGIGASPSPGAAAELARAARALRRADDFHLDNRDEKAALRTALLRFSGAK